MANRPTLLPSDALSSSYGPGTDPYALPFDRNVADAGNKFDPNRSHLYDLVRASLVSRNQQLQSLMGQLQGPSMQSVYAAGPMDQLVEAMRQKRQTQQEGLVGRGLNYSGAGQTTNRGIQRGYQEGLADIYGQSAGMETQRRQGLLQQLAGLNQADFQAMNQLGQAQLGAQANKNTESLMGLQNIMDFTRGGISLAAMLAGGVTGGLGAAAGGALAGAGQGAIQGLGVANQLYNSSDPSGFARLFGQGQTPNEQQSAQYGGAPTSGNKYGAYLTGMPTLNKDFADLAYKGGLY